MYLMGNFEDYSITRNGTTNRYTVLGVANGRTEQLVFTAGADADVLHFANGHLITNIANLRPGGTWKETLTSSDLRAGDTTPAFPPKVPIQVGTGMTRVSVTDVTGENIPGLYQGASIGVRGNRGVDTVWVTNGTTVDATSLAGENDKIYMEGYFADYTITRVGSTNRYLVQGVANGRTESLTFAVGSDADTLHFADGSVVTSLANLRVNNVFLSTVGADKLLPTNPTPGLNSEGPSITTVTSSLANDLTYSLADLEADDDLQVTFTVTFDSNPGSLTASNFGLRSGVNSLSIASVTVDVADPTQYTVVARVNSDQDGVYTLQFKGQNIEADQATFTLDLTEPTIANSTITVGADAWADAFVNSAEWSDAANNAIAWQGALSESLSSLRVSFGSTELLNASSGLASGSFSQSLSLDAIKTQLTADGAIDLNTGLALVELDVVATDTNGNASHSTLTVQLDTLALMPSLTSLLPNTVWWGGGEPLVLEGTAFEAGTLVLNVLDGSALLHTQSTVVPDAGDWQLNLADSDGLSIGESYTFQLAFTDGAGNTETAGFTRTFQVL